MKRIGILTFHKSINYGAYMQCYALSHRLQNDFPDCCVEVIDYVPERTATSHKTQFTSYILGSRANRLPWRMSAARLVATLKNPKILSDHRNLVGAFSQDWKKLPLSEFSVCSDDYEMVLQHIAERYDIVVAGSDAIWEYVIYPFPNVYYLGNEQISARFSYAASSDRMFAPHVSQKDKEYIRCALQGYRYVGVRDVATEQFIHDAFPEVELHHNCDPTVLLNLDDLPLGLDRVRKKLTDRGIDLTKPVIGIMGDDNIGKVIRDIFGKEYQIVAVYTNTKYADCFLEDLRPLEWARVFSLFSITFTRYFHGTILSLKNGTPTITLDPWKMEDETHITKIHDFYKRTDLLGHYFRKKQFYTPEDIRTIEQAARHYMAKPDREQIAAGLAKEAQSYESFRKAMAEWTTNV